MAYSNFGQVEQDIQLINAALSRSAWHNKNLDPDTTNPSTNQNAIAIKDVGGQFEFYISTNFEGDVWTWKKINVSDGGFMIVADTTELFAINTLLRKQGMSVYVESEKTEYKLLGGIENDYWVANIIRKTVPANSTETVNLGLSSVYSVAFVDYSANAVGIESGKVTLTKTDDSLVYRKAVGDDLNINLTKTVDTGIRLNIINNSNSTIFFQGSVTRHFNE